MLLWRMWLNRGSGLLAGELASSWRCLFLSGGLPSTGFRLLLSMISMTSFDGEVFLH
jgi:hypothetical protein